MIRHIVALDAQRGIAKHGAMPAWKLPTDEAYFMQQTMKYGGQVLMGRKTLDEALHGRPLKERHNYIVTHNAAPSTGVTNVTNLALFLAGWPESQDLWIIGGAEIYEQTLHQADELYITEIDGNFDCDRFYPAYDQDFELTYRSEPISENHVSYTFCVYHRRSE